MQCTYLNEVKSTNLCGRQMETYSFIVGMGKMKQIWHLTDMAVLTKERRIVTEVVVYYPLSLQ